MPKFIAVRGVARPAALALFAKPSNRTPAAVFDRAVVKTLSQWRYNAGKDGRNVEIDIEFKR